MNKIFHLYKKIDKSNKYYGSLSALCKDNKDLMVSKSKLDKWNFKESFENGLCVVIKSIMKTTGDISNISIHELLSDNKELTLLDNSKLRSLFAVEIAKLTLSDQDESIIDAIRFSSLLLDIGKCCNSFQKSISNPNKKEKSKFLYNEVGWAFLTKHLHDKGFELILDCIYWNNGISTNKNKQIGGYNNNNVMDTVDESDKSRMLGFLNEILPISVCNHNNRDIKSEAPMYCSKNRVENAKNTFIRTCVISAEKLICSLDVNKLREVSKKQDLNEIKKLIDGLTRRDFYGNKLSFGNYDQRRLQIQRDIIGLCDKTTIVNATSGFGKSLIGVLWNLLSSNKKMIWVCPRNDVAQSVYINILKELNSLGILNDISVELYLTGRRKKNNSKRVIEDFNSDIIVTNIDNFLSPSINTNNAERLFFIINCDVVFDEYHEFVGDKALFAGFVNIMNTRSRFSNSRTILLSATPLKINNLWDNGINYVTKILPTDDSHYPSAHKKKYELNTFELDGIDAINVKPKTSSVIVLNSISNSQIIHNQIGSGKLIHSNFCQTDKNGIFEYIYEKFDKNSSRIFSKENITGTHVIQASLDISFLNLHESVLSPQSTLQRIGRCDRFGDYEKVSKISIYRFNDKGENKMKEILYTKSLSDKWFEFIGKYNGKEMNLDKFYSIYNEFHKINSIEINRYIENCHDKSLLNFMNIFPKHNNREIKTSKKITANSNKLRSSGDDIFFICKVHNSEKYSDAISANNYSHFNGYGEDGKTFGRMKKAMKTIRDSGDERYNYTSLIDDKKTWDINTIRESARYSDTPYIRFDVVYHREYGVIKKSVFNQF